ncbi:MAG TPA: pectinesterase family protein [Pseudonocardiaceae bacterium]|nr:pectinesterase family protein [Pseudonocardiaceae bacterium]
MKTLSAVTAACALLLGAGSAAASTAPAHLVTPPAHGQHTCVDTPLTITFANRPALGTSGTITVHHADGSAADVINLADPTTNTLTLPGAIDTSGAPHRFTYHPVLIEGDTATIHPHHELGYGQTYYVTIDPGVFTGVPGFNGITSPVAWRFITRPTGPPTGAGRITVDAGGNGEFCTVEGAITAVPDNNQRPVTIVVAPGTYTELDWVPVDKPHITVAGAGQGATIIQYANNDKLNGQSSGSVCPRQLIPGHDNYNCWRADVNVEADDFALRDLTVHNTTPYGGSQAEAFRGNADRIVLDHVTLLSYQDTMRLQGRGYVTHSLIQGDVDFTWGFGAVMIADSELESMHAGYVTQVRNDATHHGYVFLRDRLTAAAGVANGSVYLGRIDPTVYPYSQAVFIDTAMGPHIATAGWLLNNADCGKGGNLQFWEYGSADLTGKPLDASHRLSCSQQLTAAQATVWSDPTTVLSGWNPAMAHGAAPAFPGDGAAALSAPWSGTTATTETTSAADAYRGVSANAGALPRDQVDTHVIADVTALGRSGTGLGNDGYGTA